MLRSRREGQGGTTRRRSTISRLAAFLWISLGAVLGANTRYLVNRVMAQWLGTAFPYGTFVVNVFGCLAIGVIATMITGRLIDRPEVIRLVLIVGFLGSLTTFSSFAYETHTLFQDGAWVRALANIVLSVFGGLVGVRLGMLLTPGLGAFL
ncbi:MAG: fluoride efflux transporter CrcB [Candidatus Eisenbacteria bacterium]